MQLPIEFLGRLKKDYPQHFDQILDSFDHEAPTAIRYNYLKYKGDSTVPVPWCLHATYLDHRPSFTLDPIFHGGAYYVQEASSMVLYEILNQINLSSSSCILDLCAAPGGKSTLVLDYLKEDGLLVCNEVIKSRTPILRENIIKWGHSNAVVTNNDPKDFTKIIEFFDLVIIDAPCSGEGMFRKDAQSRSEWSESNVKTCTLRQQRIVDDVISSLKPGGYLIYSTCTFNHDENILNVSKFCNQYNLDSIPLKLKSFGMEEVIKDQVIGYQLFPGVHKGEGFFIAVLQKKGTPHSHKVNIKSKLRPLTKNEKAILSNWIKPEMQLYINDNGDIYAYKEKNLDQVFFLLNRLHVTYSGIKCGNLNKTIFTPEHSLALSMIVHESIAKVELDKMNALKYLNKSLSAIDSQEKGWMIATYQGIALGWLKNIGNRINNHYPNEWKIRIEPKI